MTTVNSGSGASQSTETPRPENKPAKKPDNSETTGSQSGSGGKAASSGSKSSGSSTPVATGSRAKKPDMPSSETLRNYLPNLYTSTARGSRNERRAEAKEDDKPENKDAAEPGKTDGEGYVGRAEGKKDPQGGDGGSDQQNRRGQPPADNPITAETRFAPNGQPIIGGDPGQPVQLSAKTKFAPNGQPIIGGEPNQPMGLPSTTRFAPNGQPIVGGNVFGGGGPQVRPPGALPEAENNPNNPINPLNPNNPVNPNNLPQPGVNGQGPQGPAGQWKPPGKIFPNGQVGPMEPGFPRDTLTTPGGMAFNQQETAAMRHLTYGLSQLEELSKNGGQVSPALASHLTQMTGQVVQPGQMLKEGDQLALLRGDMRMTQTRMINQAYSQTEGAKKAQELEGQIGAVRKGLDQGQQYSTQQLQDYVQKKEQLNQNREERRVDETNLVNGLKTEEYQRVAMLEQQTGQPLLSNTQHKDLADALRPAAVDPGQVQTEEIKRQKEILADKKELEEKIQSGKATPKDKERYQQRVYDQFTEVETNFANQTGQRPDGADRALKAKLLTDGPTPAAEVLEHFRHADSHKDIKTPEDKRRTGEMLDLAKKAQTLQAENKDLDITDQRRLSSDMIRRLGARNNLKDMNFDNRTMRDFSFDNLETQGTSFKNTKFPDQSYFTDSRFFPKGNARFEPNGEAVSDPKTITDFSGAKMSQAHFTNTVGDNARFNGADLYGADFVKGSFRDTDFSGAQLSGSRVLGTDMSRSQFANTEMSGFGAQSTNLEGAYFDNADVINFNQFNTKTPNQVNLSGSVIRNSRFENGNFRGDNLSQSVIEGSNLKNADLSGTNLNKAIVNNSDLSRATFDKDSNLQEATLVNTNLNDAQMNKVKAGGINLSGSSLRGTQLKEAELPRANMMATQLGTSQSGQTTDLSKANLQEANLYKAKLTNGNFKGANMEAASLQSAEGSGNFEGARLTGANLLDARLENSNLKGADLSGACLQGADLSNTKVDGSTNFSGAVYDDQTRLPGAGTESAQAEFARQNGMIHVRQVDIQQRALAVKATVDQLGNYFDNVKKNQGWVSDTADYLQRNLGSAGGGALGIGLDSNKSSTHVDGKMADLKRKSIELTMAAGLDLSKEDYKFYHGKDVPSDADLKGKPFTVENENQSARKIKEIMGTRFGNSGNLTQEERQKLMSGVREGRPDAFRKQAEKDYQSLDDGCAFKEALKSMDGYLNNKEEWGEGVSMAAGIGAFVVCGALAPVTGGASLAVAPLVSAGASTAVLASNGNADGSSKSAKELAVRFGADAVAGYVMLPVSMATGGTANKLIAKQAAGYAVSKIATETGERTVARMALNNATRFGIKTTQQGLDGALFGLTHKTTEGLMTGKSLKEAAWEGVKSMPEGAVAGIMLGKTIGGIEKGVHKGIDTYRSRVMSKPGEGKLTPPSAAGQVKPEVNKKEPAPTEEPVKPKPPVEEPGTPRASIPDPTDSNTRINNRLNQLKKETEQFQAKYDIENPPIQPEKTTVADLIKENDNIHKRLSGKFTPEELNLAGPVKVERLDNHPIRTSDVENALKPIMDVKEEGMRRLLLRDLKLKFGDMPKEAGVAGLRPAGTNLGNDVTLYLGNGGREANITLHELGHKLTLAQADAFPPGSLNALKAKHLEATRDFLRQEYNKPELNLGDAADFLAVHNAPDGVANHMANKLGTTDTNRLKLNAYHANFEEALAEQAAYLLKGRGGQKLQDFAPEVSGRRGEVMKHYQEMFDAYGKLLNSPEVSRLGLARQGLSEVNTRLDALTPKYGKEGQMTWDPVFSEMYNPKQPYRSMMTGPNAKSAAELRPLIEKNQAEERLRLQRVKQGFERQIDALGGTKPNEAPNGRPADAQERPSVNENPTGSRPEPAKTPEGFEAYKGKLRVTDKTTPEQIAQQIDAAIKDKGRVILGRDQEQADILFPDDKVSRKHLEIRRDGDNYLVTNFSQNGTYANVDGQPKRITGTETLPPGETLAIGGQSRFKLPGEAPNPKGKAQPENAQPKPQPQDPTDQILKSKEPLQEVEDRLAGMDITEQPKFLDDLIQRASLQGKGDLVQNLQGQKYGINANMRSQATALQKQIEQMRSSGNGGGREKALQAKLDQYQTELSRQNFQDLVANSTEPISIGNGPKNKVQLPGGDERQATVQLLPNGAYAVTDGKGQGSPSSTGNFYKTPDGKWEPINITKVLQPGSSVRFGANGPEWTLPKSEKPATPKNGGENNAPNTAPKAAGAQARVDEYVQNQLKGIDKKIAQELEDYKLGNTLAGTYDFVGGGDALRLGRIAREQGSPGTYQDIQKRTLADLNNWLDNGMPINERLGKVAEILDPKDVQKLAERQLKLNSEKPEKALEARQIDDSLATARKYGDEQAKKKAAELMQKKVDGMVQAYARNPQELKPYEVAELRQVAERNGDLASMRKLDDLKNPGMPKVPSPAEEAALRKELYPNGVENMAFKQGKTGDCYLLASVDALANHPEGANYLKSLVKPNGDGSFSIQFPGQSPQTITKRELDRGLFGMKKGNAVDGPLGLELLERGYGRTFRNDPGRTLTSMGGGYENHTLSELTGLPSESKSASGNQSWANSGARKMAEAREALDNLARNRDSMVASAATVSEKAAGGQYADPSRGIYSGHAYSIRNVDAAKKTVDIVDPHDNSKVKTLSYDEFFNSFNRLSYVTIPKRK